MKALPNICPVCGNETGSDYFTVPVDSETGIKNLYPHKGCASQLREQLGIRWELYRYDNVALETNESD